MNTVPHPDQVQQKQRKGIGKLWRIAAKQETVTVPMLRSDAVWWTLKLTDLEDEAKEIAATIPRSVETGAVLGRIRTLLYAIHEQLEK